MRLTKALMLGTAAVASAAISAPSRANTVFGSLYETGNTSSLLADAASIPTTAPQVTFTAPDPLNFSTGDYTIGGFLSTGNGSTILTGGSFLGDSLNGSLIVITGTVTVTTGQTFTAGHDDGLTLTIGGTSVIDTPGPTSFSLTTETYTGPSGNEPFELIYAETAGAPADLSISLPFSSPIPEPLSLAVTGAGLAALGLIRRRG